MQKLHEVFGFTILLLLADTNAVSASTYLLPESATVNDWLDDCGKNKDDCANYVAAIAINDAGTKICEPPTINSTDRLADPVISWFHAHPGTGSLNVDAGIFLAMKSIYPCQ